jgi:hypothetical protein
MMVTESDENGTASGVADDRPAARTSAREARRRLLSGRESIVAMYRA